MWQRLQKILPKNASTIKVDVEKLLKVDLIYPMPLMEWVSNIMPVTKKQGTI